MSRCHISICVSRSQIVAKLAAGYLRLHFRPLACSAGGPGFSLAISAVLEPRGHANPPSIRSPPPITTSSKRSPRLTRTNSCSATKSWQRGLSRSRRIARGSRPTGASKEGPRSDGRADGPHGARDGGDTVLNLVVASGYLSSLMGNPRVAAISIATTRKSSPNSKSSSRPHHGPRIRPGLPASKATVCPDSPIRRGSIKK